MTNTRRQTSAHMLEAQLNYRVEAHKCGLGTLARGTLVTIESCPNITRGLCSVVRRGLQRRKMRRNGSESSESKLISENGVE